MLSLKNKVAIVTGGTRGIGRAIVETLAAAGSNVIFTGTSSCITDDYEKKLQQFPAEHLFIHADASSATDTERVIQTVMEKYGRIDILINNAGINHDTLLMRMTETDWDDVIRVNLKSVYLYTKAVQPVMLKQRSGSIINISSVVGIGGNAGQANYAAAKAGIIGFTKSVAKELGSRQIRCNAIAPGLIDTDMTRKMSPESREKAEKMIALRRIGTPEEVAKVVLFLASDLSTYVTGQIIQCDGGM